MHDFFFFSIFLLSWNLLYTLFCLLRQTQNRKLKHSFFTVDKIRKLFSLLTIIQLTIEFALFDDLFKSFCLIPYVM